MSKLWTKKEQEILKAMAENGFSAKDVKKVLKSRTECSINQQASALGLSLSGPEPEIDLDAYARIMRGETKCL